MAFNLNIIPHKEHIFFMRILGIFSLGGLCFGLPVSAGVIQSTTAQNDQYELHHKVIIYGKLSSFQNSQGGTAENYTGTYFNANTFRGTSPRLSTTAEFANLTPHSTLSNNQSLLGLPPSRQRDQNSLVTEDVTGLSVGSFLDSFKDDPSLRTIYFTSKAITFGYQSKIANVMQLDFNAENETLRRVEHSRDKGFAVERPPSEDEKKVLKRETRQVFGFLSDSFRDIVLVLVSMFGGLYLCFRYILGRYI